MRGLFLLSERQVARIAPISPLAHCVDRVVDRAGPRLQASAHVQHVRIIFHFPNKLPDETRQGLTLLSLRSILTRTMDPDSSQATLTDLIVFRLTEDIVANRLLPGHALDEGRLGQRFGVSRTPVREALRQLAASGLVQLRPHRTPLVAHVDESSLGDMFDVMAELEALCAARASVAMTPIERARLEQHHAAMGDAMRAADVMLYRAGNVTFHTLIYHGSHNAYLAELALSTRERLAPYRGAQLEAPHRLARSYREHDAILTAILRGQAQLAADLMRDHLGNTRAQLALMNPVASNKD